MPLYVAMKLNKWENMHEAETKRPLAMEGKSVGCLLVFETIEQLRVEYPEARFVKIEPELDFIQ